LGEIRPWLVGLLAFIVLPPVIAFGLDLVFGSDLALSVPGRVLVVGALFVTPVAFAFQMRGRGFPVSVTAGLIGGVLGMGPPPQARYSRADVRTSTARLTVTPADPLPAALWLDPLSA